MGNRLFSITNCEGIYPVKSDYTDVLPNFILNGDFIAYENTLVFEDSTLHNFVVDYKDIAKIKFYIGKDTWAEIRVSSNSSFPMNTFGEKRFFVNIKNTLYSKDMNLL